jgi:hypothetical protein
VGDESVRWIAAYAGEHECTGRRRSSDQLSGSREQDYGSLQEAENVFLGGVDKRARSD